MTYRKTLVATAVLFTAGCGGGGGSLTVPSSTSTTAPVTVTRISASASTTTLNVGEAVTVTATATYSDGTSATISPTWTSSDTSVATVSAAGTVTALTAGTATVTATAGGETEFHGFWGRVSSERGRQDAKALSLPILNWRGIRHKPIEDRVYGTEFREWTRYLKYSYSNSYIDPIEANLIGKKYGG